MIVPAVLAAALVWLPPETFGRWSQVDGLLRARPELKLTIALTPQMATPLAKAALAPWTAQGRVEIAARIHGDPLLPLVAAHPAAPRPDDALERAAQAREAVERRMGVPVPGFVPGDGALDASLIGPLGASGAAWVLAGPYDLAVDSWAAEGRVVLVPARAAGDPAEPGAFVVDESSRAESGALPAFASLGGRRPKGGWTTVAELVKSAGGAHVNAAAVASWPGWDGRVAGEPSDPSARAAWSAYGEAAKALARYQNSGAADLKVLENATLLLRRAQDARFFRAPEPDAAAGLPAGLRASLLAVYRRIKTPAPDALYDAGTSTASAATAEAPTSVHAASGASWVGFDNPVGTFAVSPSSAPNADPWRLRGLRVEWDDERVLFRIEPGRVDAVSAAPAPAYDVYVDLNHVVGAGAIRLLDGRGAFAQARDAWEFALSVDAGGARLWRAGAGAEPDEIAKLPVERDPVKTEIRISVPRALLRGNPARWGYILLALADEPARRILGLLAPLEIQKVVLKNPGAPHRVPAVRLER